MTAPLVPIALGFGVGVWLGLTTPAPAWLPAAAAGVLGLAVWARRRHRLEAASAAVLLVVALAGWARVALPDPMPALTGLTPGEARVEGLVTAEPERDGPRTRLPLLLRAARQARGAGPATGSLLVHLYGPPPPVRSLDRIRVTVTLSEPRPFLNPQDVERPAGRPREAPRLSAVGRADSVELLPADGVPWWLSVRVWVHEVVARHLPPVSSALFEGLLVGERRHLPATLLANFRSAGVFHILAISGFNVGLVAAAVFLVLRALRLPPRVAALLAVIALLAFAVVVGGQASVLRATLMGGLVLVGQIVARESHAWNGLAAALLVLLAWDPDLLADAGLQLSFAATAGILHLGPAIRDRLPARWPRPLREAFAVSGGAQLAVTPLMLVQWNQLSLIGLVANLVVVPLTAALTTMGLLTVVIAVASDTLTHLLFQGLWVLLLALRLCVRMLAAVPGAMIHVPTPPAPALGAAVVALVMAPWAAGARLRILLLGFVAFAILATAAGYLPDGRFHVLMLDVGQGDAILVRGPDGTALLVDTGPGAPGRLDRGERVVLPALHRAGIRRLAALVLTHGDPDHTGGLASVLEGTPIDEVWIAAGTESAAWQVPVTAAGVPRRALARGDRIWAGPLLVTVLHPARPEDTPVWLNANNRSLILRVEWGLAAVVLTGDGEGPAEHAVLESGLPLRAPVLKVGHHGSGNASMEPFLTEVRPRFALISVGPRNPFGHPSSPVLARLATAGADIYRTDLDGAVEVESDGASLSIRRWAHPARPEVFLLNGAP